MKIDYQTKIIKASPALMSHWLQHITINVPQHFTEWQQCFVFRSGAKLVYEGANRWHIYGYSKHDVPAAFVELRAAELMHHASIQLGQLDQMLQHSPRRYAGMHATYADGSPSSTRI